MSSTARQRRRRQSWFGLKRPVKRVVALPVLNPLARAVVRRRSGEEAAARLPAPVTVRRVEGRVDDVRFTMNDPARCIIAKELHWGRGRRPRAQDHFALEVFARLARRTDRVLDIGSYTGVFSVVAAGANPQARVDAFEIVPSNFLACWGNVIANDLVGRVEVHLAGVGETGTIRVPAGTGGSALPDFWSVEDQADGDEGVHVPVLDLGTALGMSRGPVAADGVHPGPPLVKVDVEGHEGALVTAGRDVIAAERPTFLMEILPDADVGALVDVFAAADYGFYLITADRLVAHERPHGDADHRDWLICALTPDALESAGIPLAA